MTARIRLIGGPLDGNWGYLTKTPPVIEIAGLRYERVDDPDTGEFLGAYVSEKKELDRP